MKDINLINNYRYRLVYDQCVRNNEDSIAVNMAMVTVIQEAIEREDYTILETGFDPYKVIDYSVVFTTNSSYNWETGHTYALCIWDNNIPVFHTVTSLDDGTLEHGMFF